VSFFQSSSSGDFTLVVKNDIAKKISGLPLLARNNNFAIVE
jgi:hypothetical protein